MARFKRLSRRERAKFERTFADALADGNVGEVIASLERGIKKYLQLGNDHKVQHRRERLYYALHGRWEAELRNRRGRPVEVLDLTRDTDEDDGAAYLHAPLAALPNAGSSAGGSSARAAASSRVEFGDDELSSSVELGNQLRSASLSQVVRRRPPSPSPELFAPDLAPAEQAPESPVAARGEAEESVRGKGEGKERVVDEEWSAALQAPPVFSAGETSNRTAREYARAQPSVDQRAETASSRRRDRTPSPSGSVATLPKRRRTAVQRLGPFVEHAERAEQSAKEDGTAAEESASYEGGKGGKGKSRRSRRQCSTSVARLFPPSMWTTTGKTLETIKAENEADEAVLLEVTRLVNTARGKKAGKVRARKEVGTGRVLVDQGKKVAQGRSDPVTIYTSAEVDKVIYRRHDWVVTLGDGGRPWFGRIEYFHKSPAARNKGLQVHVAWASTSRSQHGSAAHARHLLLIDECSSSSATSIVAKIEVRKGNEESVARPAFFFSAMYEDNKSTSPPIPADAPTPACVEEEIPPCPTCERLLVRQRSNAVDGQGDAIPLPRWLDDGSLAKGFTFDGEDYHIGDWVYMRATAEAQETAHWNGAQAPFRLARLVRINVVAHAALTPSSKLSLQPLVRLGHLKKAKRRRERQLVDTDVLVEVTLENLVGHFQLKHGKAPSSPPMNEPDKFWVRCRLVTASSVATRKAVIALWQRPPTLLQPPADLDDNLQEQVVPLELEELVSCTICAEVDRRKAEQEAQVVEGCALSGLSLYSGLDLLGMGLEEACPLLRTRVAIEREWDVAEAFRLNHPEVEVRRAAVDEVLKAAWLARSSERARTAAENADDTDAIDVLDVDVVFGGPPCQSFSRLNRSPDPLDPRLLQILVMLSFFETGRPLLGLMENVSRLGWFSYGDGEKGNLLGAATDLAIRFGYETRQVVLDAAAYGVAQHRRRIFLELSKAGLPLVSAPEQTHAVSTRLTGQTQLRADEDEPTSKVPFGRRAALQSAPHPAVVVAEAFSSLPRYNASPEEGHVAGPGGLTPGGNKNDVSLVASPSILERINHIGIHEEGGPAHGDYRDLPPRLALKPPPTLSKQKKGDYWRRLWPEEIAATLTTRMRPEGLNGCFIHPWDDRILSLRECLVLQGAPDDLNLYPLVMGAEWGLTKEDVELGYKLIGNGVAVPVAAAFGREIMKVATRLVLKDTARSTQCDDDMLFAHEGPTGSGDHDDHDDDPASYFARISRRLDAGERFDGAHGGANTAA